MKNSNFGGAGSLFVGTALGLGTSIALPSIARLPALRYGLEVTDIGGPKYGPMANQRGSISLKLVTPDNGGIDIHLKSKSNWTEAQRAEAIAKAGFLNDALTVVTKSDRPGTAPTMDRYRKANEAPFGSDLDHRVDLQLSGSKAIDNLK